MQRQKYGTAFIYVFESCLLTILVVFVTVLIVVLVVVLLIVLISLIVVLIVVLVLITVFHFENPPLFFIAVFRTVSMPFQNQIIQQICPMRSEKLTKIGNKNNIQETKENKIIFFNITYKNCIVQPAD